jgi:hypothetical protein
MYKPNTEAHGLPSRGSPEELSSEKLETMCTTSYSTRQESSLHISFVTAE